MLCLFCDKEIEKNKFCDSSCAISYNNQNRTGKTKKKNLCARCLNHSKTMYCTTCYNNEKPKYKYEMIKIGDKINNLIVISDIVTVQKTRKNGNNFNENGVDCKCICGKIIYQCVSNLLSNNIIGCGCESSIKLDTKKFIDKANLIHNNKYQYDKVDYKNNTEWVIITCKTHGDYKVRPYEHLRGANCKRCILTLQSSQAANNWLDSLNIKDLIREYLIPNTKYIADGYDQNTNTIYEYNGSFFHGNPKIYNQDDINPKSKRTFGDLYKRTLKKQKILIELGYKLITCWGE